MRLPAIFALIALAELGVFIWVQSVIGLGWTLLLGLTTALIGVMLVRRAGLSAIGRITSITRNGELPGRQLSDASALLVAGLLLITPGFITDSLGVLLLLAPVREVIYRVATRRVSRRVTVSGTELRTGTQAIHGEIIDIDPE